MLQVDRDRPDAGALAEAAAILTAGGLVAFATETVYGLGAIATEPEAVARIFQAKGRPAFNPLIVHVADADQARPFVVAWPEAANRLADHFWPGPLTLVLPGSGRIPSVVTAGRETVAIRVPATPVARRLVAETGRPLAAPSANRSNRLSPTTAEHVLGDLDGRIDLILDSGPTAEGLESTVLDLTASPARILRPGPISTAELEGCLAGLDSVESARHESSAEAPASPGMLPVHYAPRTQAWRVESPDQLAGFAWPASVSVLVLGRVDMSRVPASADCVRLDDPRSAARQLYRVLHELDARGNEAIIVVFPPDEPEWAAVRDRLLRATRPVD